MTAEPPFAPTLKIPRAWIEELTGTTNDAEATFHLSYMPHLEQKAAELGSTLQDVHDDLQNGYQLKKVEGDRGEFYLVISEHFKLYVHPQQGRASGAQLAVIGKIDRRLEPHPIMGSPLRPIVLTPIQQETRASPDAILSYQAALRRLASPAPVELAAAKPKPEETDGLWRYSALAELLKILRRQSDRSPRIRVTATVLPPESDGFLEDDADAPLRVETAQALRGWRPEMPVTLYINEKAVFTTRIRDIDRQVIELEPPDVQAPKPGTRVTVEQLPRFAMAAHQRALDRFLRLDVAGVWEDLRDLIAAPENMVLGEDTPPPSEAPPSDHLTAEQRLAVERAVSTPHAFFIQGPPGTGKTTVITEIVQRLVRDGQRVLLLSNTHVAVDEVLRRAAKKDFVLPVRLTWNAAKVDAEVREYTYEHAVSALVKKVLSARQDRDHFWRERYIPRRPGGSQRIAALRRLEERWLAAGREPGAAEELEEEIGAALLGAANLICATTVGVAKKAFAHVGDVDALIVDEASRVTDAELLISAVRAKRWILVGDEHQLPPHVEPDVEYFLLGLAACWMVERKLAQDLSDAVDRLARGWEEEEQLHVFRRTSVLDAATSIAATEDWQMHYGVSFHRALQWHGEDEREAFSELLQTIRYFLVQSVFERDVAACPEGLRARLTEQRRMIEPLTHFVREAVYKGGYVTPDAATLAAAGVSPLSCDAFPMPVTFLNTELHRWQAKEEMIGTGFVNPLEAEWVVEACDRFETALARRRLGAHVTASILCFYREQARRIQDMLAERKQSHQRLQFRVIDAIDRIQGQESDIVFISFCRARDPRRPLGPTFGMWLRDIRRLNVAFTRARRALVLIGHRPTLERLGRYQPFYENMFALFEKHRSDMRMVQDFGRKRGRR